MKIFQPLNKWFDSLPGAVRAGFWITCAGAFFTGMMSIARTLSPELSILVVVFFRASFGLMFLLPTAFANGGARLRTKKLSLYAVRGISAYLSVTFFFIAATYIPLGDIAAIGFTRPFLACIAAILILGELARSRRWIAIGIGIVGALIVIRPGFQEMNPGILFAITAVLLSVCNSIMIKYLSRTEHPDSIAIYQAVFVAPYALVVALFVWTTPNLEQFAWLILIGAFGALTQRALARSFHAADATVVITLDFLRLPVAALIGLAVFGEWPIIWVWVGSIVIIASSFLLAKKEAEDKEVNKQASNIPS